MSEPKNNKLSIPIELIEYAFQKKLVKPLMIYIFLKFYSTGKVNKKSKEFDLLCDVLKIKDLRTLEKHLNMLIELNWIGYNHKSGNYFIRAFDVIRKQYKFIKRNAAVCQDFQLPILEEFFVGAIISKHINVQKYISVKRGRKNLAVLNKGDGTFQPKHPSSNHAKKYFGLSNGIIAEILGCKQTRASVLKNKACKESLIIVNHKFDEIFILESADNSVREQLYEQYPKLRGKLSFRKKKDGSVAIVKQQYDEIIPKIKIVTRKKIMFLGSTGGILSNLIIPSS